MIVETVCPICGRVNKVEMTDKQYAKYIEWKNGKGYVQDIGLNPDDSEKLLTGICSECWDNTIKGVQNGF